MTPEHRVSLAKAYCRYIAGSGRPILLGPWRSEVGFEVLYWLPFLRWFKSYTGVKAERLFPVTRGGAGVLYPHMTGADLYQLRSVDAVRLENAYDRQTTGMQKQWQFTAWDKGVLKEAATQLLGRGEKYHVLHPSWMYWALEPFWEEQRGMKHLNGITEFQPLQKPTYHALQLPDAFVAVKWYSRATFDTRLDDVKRHVSEITGTIAAQVPVVLLTSGHGGDEHTDLIVDGPNIAKLPPVPAHESVHLQAAVMSRASAFVGTYGGVAQMALRMGIPSASFYQTWGGTALAHKTLSHWLGIKTNTNFQVGNLSDTALWRRVVSVAMPVEKKA
jgi:hypothetical protein